MELEKVLELPPVFPPIEGGQKKRYAKQPDPSQLTDGQRQIYDSVQAFIDRQREGYYLIKGYAGTGKTFITTMLVEWALVNRKQLKIAITAPTNKAVRVLRDSAGYKDPNISYSTIHSLLGLKEKIDGYGNQTFVQLNEEDCKIHGYNIIIIDEVSMLSDELFDLIHPYVKLHNLKVICVGDPCQIPPINKDNCIPMSSKGQREYGIEVGELTQIVRQAEGNPIIEVTMRVRNALGRDIVLPTREDSIIPRNMDGVYFFDVERKAEFYKIMETYFCSENFQRDADFMKIVAYTNKTVDAFNRIVRKMIYGKDIGKIQIGEKLIANRVIRDDEGLPVFTNNDEFEVLSFEVVEGDYKGAELTYYDTLVKYQGLSGEVNKRIKIIHEKSEEDYKLVKSYLMELARGEPKGSWQAADKWKDFFRISEIFAEVNYNYAITAHKAQGSSYDNCMVLETDMDRNWKVIERNRIKYTAFTRPRHKLFIVS